MNQISRLRQTWHRLILSALFSMLTATVFAVDCKVNDSDISGAYEGDCINGLAHGKGKAKGLDIYEGEFKQGNKHGNGTYVWPDGPVYQGSYADDRRSGFGKMTIPRSAFVPNKVSGKGNWIGDNYVETGMFMRSNFIYACTSPEHCKQEQTNR